MIIPIRKWGDPALREKCKTAKKVDSSVTGLIKNLADTMYDAPGVGLAASQIGVLKQVITLDLGEGLEAYINPEIIWQSQEKEEDEEGCLSLIPEVKMPIKRASKIKVRALNKKGKPVVIEAEGLLARVLQHEIDHIQGRLILDRATKQERKKALKKISELTPLI